MEPLQGQDDIVIRIKLQLNDPATTEKTKGNFAEMKPIITNGFKSVMTRLKDYSKTLESKGSDGRKIGPTYLIDDFGANFNPELESCLDKKKTAIESQSDEKLIKALKECSYRMFHLIDKETTSALDRFKNRFRHPSI